MKKSAVILILLVGVIAMSFSFDGPRFENLQVLPKDTDKYQLDSVMKHFNTSLGVNCNFCHVRQNDAMQDWDFPNDSNENKLMARDMLKMTFAINKDYFNIKKAGEYGTRLQVTCYSCHYGKHHPARFPKAVDLTAPPTRQGS